MLPEILTERRKALGISIDQLVELSGVPKGTLTKVLTGVSPNPALETVKSIAYALNLTLDDLSSNPVKSVSSDAMRIAIIYDSLTDAGKELLAQSSAFASKHFTKSPE